MSDEENVDNVTEMRLSTGALASLVSVENLDACSPTKEIAAADKSTNEQEETDTLAESVNT
jgi:hypothetical protein